MSERAGKSTGSGRSRPSVKGKRVQRTERPSREGGGAQQGGRPSRSNAPSARPSSSTRSERAQRAERSQRAERARASSRSRSGDARPSSQGSSIGGAVISGMASAGAGAVAFIRKNPLVAGGAAIVVVLAFVALFAFALAPKGGGDVPAQAGTSSADAASAAAVEETPARKEPAGPFSLTFASTGDIIFGREVGTFVDMNGGAAAMANVADQLAAADVTIANVEAPLSDDESEPIPDKDVYLISRPAGIESLVASGIDLVSLANNHSMDYTGPALKDTIDALDAAGILHAGAGMTEDEAEKIAELTIGDVSIAFFSWTDIIPDNFLAFGNQPGVVSARMDMAGACKAIADAKRTHDIVIVAMHWGIEYEDYIDDYQQRTPAHQLVDAGADVIIGNHPHVIQGIEFYKGSLISYSQGDFVFDHYSERTGETFILNFDVTDQGIANVVATPVYLDDTYGIPSIVDGDHAQSILARLSEISADMNSSFDIRDDRAYISAIS